MLNQKTSQPLIQQQARETGLLGCNVPPRLPIVLLPIAGAACPLIPQVSAGLALVIGVALAILLGNPYRQATQNLSKRLLPLAVVGLGAGMDLHQVAQAGLNGIGYTVAGISFALAVGLALARFGKIPGNTGLLVTVGTAICGGSAIAAIAPILRAKSSEVTVALSTVFLLNAAALAIFPAVGHRFALTDAQFGLWCALAIHDTSSVVGAAMQFGPTALAIGTTVKLARALWIVPLALGLGTLLRLRSSSGELPEGQDAAPVPKLPWFIVGFLVTAALVTYLPGLQLAGQAVTIAAKRAMVLTLFLIGSNLTLGSVRSVGVRPFLHGAVLWVVVASVSLWAICQGWV